MLFSRRSFLRVAGGGVAAGALTSLPLRATAFRFSKQVGTQTAVGPIRLDSNENAYGPSQKVLDAMSSALNTANRYPRHEYAELAQRIADMHGVKAERVLLGCGSSEILRVAAVGLLGPGRKFVQASPTFETSERYAKLAGAEVVSIPLDPHFAHDLDGMLAHIDESTPLVYLCNPNNPTGSITPRDALEAFISKLPKNTTVLIDEAYHHFATQSAGYSSFLDHPIDDGRVMVSRTFSKVYGLAGMRLGYAIAAPKLVAQLRPYITPENVNALVLHAAFAAMGDDQGVRESVNRNADARQEFSSQAFARKLNPIASCANFVMMDVHRPADGVIEHFRKNNVWIGRHFPPLNTCIRVSFGKPAEMKEFWRVYDLLPQKTA
jgi:histidinol-phosphate aminotransferase